MQAAGNKERRANVTRCCVTHHVLLWREEAEEAEVKA